MKYLYKELEKYEHLDYYPFHVPGHKRNKELAMSTYGTDITEIDGFDNLHHPEGLIRDSQVRAAKLFSAEETFFLINGSTCGLLSAICTTTSKNGTILMARNCHKAVFHAVLLNSLKTRYIYPEFQEDYEINGGIKADDIKQALKEDSTIQAVIITSPTYDGVVSDIEEICKIAHEHGIPLIVDEAHGAHFSLDEKAPKSAIQCGADLVIHSVHKTLPALTQTALIHVNGNLVNREKLKKYLSIFQSSSPSYLLMASIDSCMDLMEKEGHILFEKLHCNQKSFYEKVQSLQKIKIANEDIIGNSSIKDFDSTKIVISVKNMQITGQEIYDILREKYHLQMEMAASNYVIGITTVMDKEQGFNRLAKALLEIDNMLESSLDQKNNQLPVFRKHNIVKEARYTIGDAFLKDTVAVALEDSINKVSAEFLYVYPPGIPILVPGEVISEQALKQVLFYKKKNLHLQGLTDYNLSKIMVIDDVT